MNKTKLILLSLSFILATPIAFLLSFFMQEIEEILYYFLLSLIFLSFVAIISFTKLNILLTTKKIPKLFLIWFSLNFIFSIIYIVFYIINLGVIRQIHGWYSDMAGVELLIIMPMLVVYSVINLIAILIARKKMIEFKH